MDRRRSTGLALATAATIVLFAAAIAGVGTASARTSVDLRAGVYTGASGLAIGGGLVGELHRGSSWLFNPNLEIVFPGGGNVFTMNGDFHYEFPSAGSVGGYAGVGPAILISSPDVGNSHTDFGVNLIAGIIGLRGHTHPFAQAKGVLSNNSEFVLMGGVRF